MSALVLLAVGCETSQLGPIGPKEVQANPPAEWSDAWLIEEGQRYLEDGDHRRQSMLAALVNHENLYSRTRIASYGLGDRAWDRLPEWNPRSRTINAADRELLQDGQSVDLGEVDPLWDGEPPESMQEWVSLGRQVFLHYPLRADRWLEHGLRNRETGERFGIVEHDGQTPGAIVFRDVDGHDRIGISCAICHTDLADTGVIEGRARRTFNYGGLQIDFAQARGSTIDPELAQRMAGWGPGRADITEDDDEDPVAIPDLWGLRHQSHLTQAGTIRHVGPIAVALRQETQYLYANHHRARPPRALMWALTLYLYSLSPPQSDAAPPDALGEQVFDRLCAECHSNDGYGGAPVNAQQVGTDPGLSRGIARGTGRYRPSGLIRVADAGPYFHHGAVASLDDVLSRERLEPSYLGPLGEGAVPGHEYGLELETAETQALLSFLRTL